ASGFSNPYSFEGNNPWQTDATTAPSATDQPWWRPVNNVARGFINWASGIPDRLAAEAQDTWQTLAPVFNGELQQQTQASLTRSNAIAARHGWQADAATPVWFEMYLAY